MKYLLAVFLLFQFSIGNTATEKTVLSSSDETVQTSINELEAFSKKKLSKKDLPALKKNMKTLLVLDDLDPSREAVIVLSESYNKNKALYDKALKSVETKKNKAQLKEIKSLLKSHYSEGND
jgi:hypothetical protein